MASAEISIGRHKVGGDNPCLIIAEIGPNHDGSIKRAKKLVSLAKDCGCDGIKFQYHLAEEEIADKTSTIPWSGEVRYDFIKRVQEFTSEEHGLLRQITKEKGLLYISSPFSIKAAEILDDLNLDAFKIASGEITNYELIEKCCATGKPVILSCGMSGLDEVDASVNIALGTGNKDIMLLQCTSEYPTRYEDINLRTIQTFLSRYSIPIGLSDHSQDIIPAIASVALGCRLIEKHFTEDKGRNGPDHAVSLEPEQMKMMVESVRNLERALGDGVKKPGPNAAKMRETFLNSIVCAVPVPAGTIVERKHFCFKKPGTGLPPSALDKLIGMKAKTGIDVDSIVRLEDFVEA